MNTLHNIERYYRVIDQSLFTINGDLDYDRITDAVIKLSNAVHDYDDDTDNLWAIGEDGECGLPDLLVGAYWHYTEWHGGQWSKGYEALSAIGQVFDPGMTSPEPDNYAYQSLNDIAS